MTPTVRKILIPLLLIVGLQLWLLFNTTLHANQVYVMLAALALAGIPVVHRFTFRMIQRIRRVTPRTRAITAVAVFVIAAGYITFTAHRQGRALYPKYHDNQSYAIQAQIIASGRLWLPAHAHSEFFDTFHVLVEPVYASMYFPGAAMVFAIGVLLGLPFWVTAVVIAAGCTAMLYRVIAEIVDNFAGLLAALWLVSLIWFRHLSTMLMSHSVLLLLGLTMFWAYLRWRRERRVRWCLVIGLVSGLAAVTRPADALCYAIPIGIAILLDLGRRHFAEHFRAGVMIVAGAVPFLLIQVIFNLGVSGKPFESPYRVYLDRDAPQLSFGFHEFDPSIAPKSQLPQKQIYHDAYNADLIRTHRPGNLFQTWLNLSTGRLRLILESTTPSLLLGPFLLLGFLTLTTRPRVALFMILPLYCLLYLFYAALLRHYTPAIAPATILIGVLGIHEWETIWPRARAAMATLAAVMTVGLCIIVLPEVNPHMADDPFPYPEMVDARENIPKNVERPALVFVKFTPLEGQNVHSEPVYNFDAARIDDNPIIYAHDLGPAKNGELLRYYAQLQPQRHVYHYDRITRLWAPGGTVVEELKRLKATLPTTTPAATTPAPTPAAPTPAAAPHPRALSTTAPAAL